MMKTIKIDSIQYNLFTTQNNEAVEKFIFDSRKYNDGLDFFNGSDCLNVYIYMVSKLNVDKFIEFVNEFIRKCENLKVQIERGYIESVNDFSFLHKSIENSEYDFFISNFDFNFCDTKNQELIFDFDKLLGDLSSVSDYLAFAGADYDDVSIGDAIIGCLFRNNKRIVKKTAKDFPVLMHLIEDLQDEDMSERIMMQSNVKDKNILFKFIDLYIENTPKAISNEDLMDEFIKKCIENIKISNLTK